MHRCTQRMIGLVISLSWVILFYTNVGALTLVQNGLVSVSAIVGSLPVIDTAIGGGGSSYQSGIRFSGYAYPFGLVTVQHGDGTTTAKADAKGYFAITIPDSTWKLFSVFAVDRYGYRSTLFNVPAALYSGYLTDIASIRFAPTITTDKIAVTHGEYLTVSGYAVPSTTLTISLSGPEQQVYTLSSNEEGRYTLTVPIMVASGTYAVTAQYPSDGKISKTMTLIVGTTTLSRLENTSNIPGDCNVDQQITLIDFSVLAYWYKRDNPPACVDVNHDGAITLADFSIMAFYWN